MLPLWIIVVSSLSILFITLGTGSNASMNTKNRSSVNSIKFALFMAISHFFFYYIGAFIAKPLMNWVLNDMRPMMLMASVLLFAIAVKTIWNVFSYKVEDNFYDLSKSPIQLFLSIAGGLNGLLCGIALTLSIAPHLNTALIISLGAFVGTMSGAGLSPDVAKKVTKLRPAMLGGIGFLIITIFLFVQYF